MCPNAASQIIDHFNSSLVERRDTIMLLGSRRNFPSKREHYTVQNNITVECGRQYFLLCTCQETDNVYVNTYVQKGGNSSIQVHF